MEDRGWRMEDRGWRMEDGEEAELPRQLRSQVQPTTAGRLWERGGGAGIGPISLNVAPEPPTKSSTR
jgi:hypothetical protein